MTINILANLAESCTFGDHIRMCEGIFHIRGRKVWKIIWKITHHYRRSFFVQKTSINFLQLQPATTIWCRVLRKFHCLELPWNPDPPTPAGLRAAASSDAGHLRAGGTTPGSAATGAQPKANSETFMGGVPSMGVPKMKWIEMVGLYMFILENPVNMLKGVVLTLVASETWTVRPDLVVSTLFLPGSSLSILSDNGECPSPVNFQRQHEVKQRILQYVFLWTSLVYPGVKLTNIYNFNNLCGNPGKWDLHGFATAIMS